jgi:hypothetical protein
MCGQPRQRERTLHLNGKVVEWMEKVTDEQYAGAATRSR